MRANRPSTLMKKGRLVAALGRSHNFLPTTSYRVRREKGSFLQRRLDLVQRSLRLLFIYGVHQVVEMVQLVVLVLSAFGAEDLDSRDL